MSSTEKHKHLEHEIQDMIAALIHKSDASASHHHHHQQNQNGLQIITLTGSNNGATATMNGELMDDKLVDSESEDADLNEAIETYVNSNLQAINNSIMIDGSYTTNDPGVHMDISDFIDHLNDYEHGHHDLHHVEKHNEGEKRGKEKKDKEHGKSKQHESDTSD